MNRETAQTIIHLILHLIDILKPYVHEDQQKEWDEMQQVVESTVFVELEEDEKYG